MSHQTTWKETPAMRADIGPLSAAPCSPPQKRYFTLPQDKGEGSVGRRSTARCAQPETPCRGALCTLVIHLRCTRGALWSSEQNRGPPNRYWGRCSPCPCLQWTLMLSAEFHPPVGVCLQASSLLCPTWHFKCTHTNHILVSLKGKGKYLRGASACM